MAGEFDLTSADITGFSSHNIGALLPLENLSPLGQLDLKPVKRWVIVDVNKTTGKKYWGYVWEDDGQPAKTVVKKPQGQRPVLGADLWKRDAPNTNPDPKTPDN